MRRAVKSPKRKEKRLYGGLLSEGERDMLPRLELEDDCQQVHSGGVDISKVLRRESEEGKRRV